MHRVIEWTPRDAAAIHHCLENSVFQHQIFNSRGVVSLYTVHLADCLNAEECDGIGIIGIGLTILETVIIRSNNAYVIFLKKYSVAIVIDWEATAAAAAVSLAPL